MFLDEKKKPYKDYTKPLQHFLSILLVSMYACLFVCLFVRSFVCLFFLYLIFSPTVPEYTHLPSP